MKKKEWGKNHGIWMGKVVSELRYSHTLENIDTFYTFLIEVTMENKEEKEKDVSVLPVMIGQSKLNELNETIEKGKLVFIKGSWRMYDHRSKVQVEDHLEQTAYVKKIEITSSYTVRPKNRNRLKFEGILTNKLYKILRDDHGVPLKDEQNRYIPKVDKNNRFQYTVRENKEGKIVNDYKIVIHRPSNHDYIHCISYDWLAQKVADEIEIGDRVTGCGYIRSRTYEKDEKKYKTYELVVTEIEKKR
jgi:single-stranded DNA-binding protein